MPVIPTFVNDEAVPTNPGPPRADPNAFTGPGEALQRTGNQLSDIASQFTAKLADARRQADASNITAQSYQGLSDLEFNAAKIPDRDQAAQQFDQGAAALKSATLDAISDPQVRSYVAQRFNEAAITKRTNVQQAAFGLQANNQIAALDANGTMYGHQLAAAKSDIERAQITDNYKSDVFGAAAAHWITPEAAQLRWQNFLSNGDLARARQDIDNDPAGAKQRLADGTSYPNLSEDIRPVLEYRAEMRAGRLDALADRQQQEQQAGAQANVRGMFDDNMAAIARTGEPTTPYTAAQINAAYPPAQYPGVADQMLNQLDQAQRFYATTAHVALTSPDEDRQILQQWAPSGPGYGEQAKRQDMLVQVLNAKDAALAKDPAGYVANASPAVAGMFQQAAQDPTKLPAAAAALDAAYDRLGVAPDQRRLLSTDSASRMVGSILQVPPALRAAELSSMAQQFGPTLWPRVMGDLVKAKLPPEYEILSALPDPNSRTLFADALGSGGANAMRSALAPADAQAIDATINENASLQSLRTSLGYASGGAAKFDQIAQAVKMLAYRQAMTGDPGQAAASAVAALTTDKYDFWNQGGGIARVPKGALPMVQPAAADALAKLTAADVMPAPNVTGVQLTPDQLQTTALQGAQRGKWVTNEGETGLLRLSSDGRPVMLTNGARLEVPFPTQARPGAPAMPGSLPIAPPVVPGALERRMGADAAKGVMAIPRVPTYRRAGGTEAPAAPGGAPTLDGGGP